MSISPESTVAAPRPERPPAPVSRPWLEASVWRAFWTSRLVILFAGLIGAVQIGYPPGATSVYDSGNLTAPFGYFANALLAGFARWDSSWYLRVAEYGYDHQRMRMAFYPLYPALMRVLGVVTGSDLIAGVLISLVSLAIALALIHRLVSLDFGEEVATVTVTLIAFCPVSFFLSAVYTEGLFLALSVGAIYAARHERWWVCGVLGFFAALSRNGGIALILPVAVLYLYGSSPTARSGWTRLRPVHRLRPDALWLLLIPAGLLAYLAYLGLTYGDWLAPFRVEADWLRHNTFPLVTMWDGARQAWDGLRQLLQGPGPPFRVPSYGQAAIGAALQDIYLFLFLVLGIVGLVGVAWRLGVAYGIYTLALLVLALSDPVSLQPLASLPRYELVIFPLFIWGARLLIRDRLVAYATPALAVLLGVFTIEFATWRWVA